MRHHGRRDQFGHAGTGGGDRRYETHADQRTIDWTRARNTLRTVQPGCRSSRTVRSNRSPLQEARSLHQHSQSTVYCPESLVSYHQSVLANHRYGEPLRVRKNFRLFPRITSLFGASVQVWKFSNSPLRSAGRSSSISQTIQLYIAGDSTRFAALDIDDNQLVRLTGKHFSSVGRSIRIIPYSDDPCVKV